MSKRLKGLSLVVAAPLILALTSCSGAPAPRETVTVTQKAPVPTASTDCPYVDDDNCDGFYQDGEKGSPNNADGSLKDVPDDTESSQSNLETVFLSFVRQKSPILNAEEDQDLLDWANEVCSRMDDGKPFTKAALFLYTDHDMAFNDAAKFGGAAVAAFCPEYEDDISD